MRPISPGKRGMSLVELTLYALVAGIILAFFIFFFWRTGRTHEQQSLEMSYQGSFTKLCEQLERDLSGCRSWKIQNVGGLNTSLSIDRIEGAITYDLQFEAGEINRHLNGRNSTFAFKGERHGILKMLEFIGDPIRANALTLKIELKTIPVIELSHEFSVRISADTTPGFFQEAQLEERGADAFIGQPNPAPSAVPPAGSPKYPGCPRPDDGSKNRPGR